MNDYIAPKSNTVFVVLTPSEKACAYLIHHMTIPCSAPYVICHTPTYHNMTARPEPSPTFRDAAEFASKDAKAAKASNTVKLEVS
jgi:hypothetical protein